MSQHLERLISQTLKHIPQFSKCIERIPTHNIMINYPLQFMQSKHKSVFSASNMFLNSSGTIRPKNHVFFIQANEGFASTNFTGATTAEEQRLTAKLFNLKQKYQIFDEDMINRIKLTLSVQANYLDPALPLYQYAQSILKNRKNSSIENYIKNYANSGFLKSILNSNKLAINTAYQYLQKSFMKTIQEEDFANAYETVRYFAKQTNNLRVIFPFCNNIQHSFQPNCEIKAMFLMHRRQTFISVSSLREIQPGQSLSINYGNQNNYELFVRYGFTIQNNPYGEFYLPVDYSDIEDIFNSNIEWKMQMFKKNKRLKLRNFIRITVKGEIHSDDFEMLKIVFATKPYLQVNYQKNTEFQKQTSNLIYQFVRKTAQRFLFMMEKLEKKKKQLGVIQTKKPQNQIEEALSHNINVIERQQKTILKRLITKS